MYCPILFIDYLTCWIIFYWIILKHDGFLEMILRWNYQLLYLFLEYIYIYIYIYITWCCKVIITCAHKMTAVHSTFNSVLSFTAYPNDGASYSPNSPSTCASASYHLVNAIVKRLKKKIIAKPYSSSMTAKSDLVNRFISAHTHHTNFVKQLRCLTGKARDLLDHILILLQ